jgi:hypothetical protein
VADKDPEWRATARYSREELEILISDPRLPLDRRVPTVFEPDAVKALVAVLESAQ